MAFVDLVGRLTGELPGLSPFLAQQHLNDAWVDICGERMWSFLITDGIVVCPAVVTAGSASITQYSATVTLNAAASAAVLAQTDLTAVPGLTNQQIRFGVTTPAAGHIYNIRLVDSTNPAAIVLTLDRVVIEPTAAASTYQIYRAYVTPPIADFLAWESLVDYANAITFTHKNGRLGMTSAMFDARDPQRSSSGTANFLGSYLGAATIDAFSGAVGPNANVEAGSPIYEFWPHPTGGQTFYVRFHRRGQKFHLPQDTQPAGIADSLILQRAKGWYSYPFAQANVANFPTFKGANWPTLILHEKQGYHEGLLGAKREDDEQALQTVWNRGHGLRQTSNDYGFPVDANYMQSHLLRL